MHAGILLCAFLLTSAAEPSVPMLSGAWEVQSLGADRRVLVEQKENIVIAYRVMWPQFNGEAYKLEHVFRGAVDGNKIKGELLVREDGMGEFEVLRAFSGSISGADALVLDSLPLRRTGPADGAIPPIKESVRRGLGVP